MFKHVLLASDGSEPAANAVERGLTLAKLVGADTTAVTVSEPKTVVLAALARRGGYDPVMDYDACTKAAAERILGAVRELAKQQGQNCRYVHVLDQHPGDGIVATARAEACDLIVMGSYGRRGLSKLLLGSQVAKVLALSSVPILVCRESPC
jgi:nucleotide-binding universal stress UspA family protein